jgi:hypothetical protein
MTKMTEREMYTMIRDAFENGTPVDVNEVIEFTNKKIAALDKRAAKAKERAAAKRAETDVIYEAVMGALGDTVITIADIEAAIKDSTPDATPGKISNRLMKLVDNGIAVREEITVPSKTGGRARKLQGYKLAAN